MQLGIINNIRDPFTFGFTSKESLANMFWLSSCSAANFEPIEHCCCSDAVVIPEKYNNIITMLF